MPSIPCAYHQEVVTRAYTLFEHEELTFAWEDRHLRLLERAKQVHGGDVLTATTRGGRRVLRAHQYVGTVRVGTDTITILPKIDSGDDGFRSATRNLLYMLEQAGYLSVGYQTLAPLLQHGRDWFELLTRLFADELLRQWMRGPHRHYEQVEENLTVIKGKWQIHEQLRQPGRDHRFDVVYEEFTADNRLSRIFRYVVEQLWLRTQDDGNRRLLGQLRQLLDPVRLEPRLSAGNVPPGTINRLNERFEPLLNLALLFLNTSSLELSQGNLQTFAFVFDMNRLFETFLAGVIKRHKVDVLPPVLEGCTLHPQARHHSLHLATNDRGSRVFYLKPDLAFRRGGQFPLLVDAKYKKLDRGDGSLRVSPSDFYQMFAYAHRYNTPGVILLYPQGSEPVRQIYRLSGHDARIAVATINLHRDFSRAEDRRALLVELREVLSLEVPDGSNS